jgi:hypothetical protein
MAPELVKFHDVYGDRMIVVSYNLSHNPAVEGLAVSAIPTQYLFDATGAPFRPAQFALGGSFDLITDENGVHVLTRHIGVLPFEEMVAIFDDMIGR